MTLSKCGRWAGASTDRTGFRDHIPETPDTRHKKMGKRFQRVPKKISKWKSRKSQKSQKSRKSPKNRRKKEEVTSVLLSHSFSAGTWTQTVGFQFN